MISSTPTIGITKESRDGETRVAGTPDTAKRLSKKGFKILVAKGAGIQAGFPDASFEMDGVQLVSASEALAADVVLKINRPEESEITQLKRDSLLICLAEPYLKDDFINTLAKAHVDLIAMELIPRTSRAQSMDVLSSQAGIAGYRAVLEATIHYPRFLSMMMTSAGSSKPAKVVVLGVGVAGLQAIGTAKRLGAQVEAYDVRPEVKEQILSMGAKFIDLDLGEDGTGTGGYAKELSEATKQKQQQLLAEKLKKADIIITTANVPGRKAPLLVTADVVQGMRAGSVIVDMAAASGGNCELTEKNRVLVKHGVTLVGLTNYPMLVPCDASSFFARNVFNLLSIMMDDKTPTLKLNLEDDIIAASLVTLNGERRCPNP